MHLFVLLPAYNESESLSRLIPSIAQTLQPIGITFKVVVVNDGSSDDTVARVQVLQNQYPVQLLSHERNRGYGAGLRTGFDWIIQNGKPEDIVVSMDADTTHDPAYLPVFSKKIAEGFDVVTASYVAPGAKVTGVPPLRRLMSMVANGLFRLAFPSKNVQTFTNGFRAYRVGALQKMAASSSGALFLETGFAGGTELFIRMLKSGARAAEIPFHLQYENRGGNSKIRLGRTIRGYLSLLWRLKHP